MDSRREKRTGFHLIKQPQAPKCSLPIPFLTDLQVRGMSEQPFQVAISDAELEFLHKKLELVKFPDELQDAGWGYGVPLADVQRLVARWRDGYDWRRFEAVINQLPQFTRDIKVEGFSTLNIHYIHQKSEVGNAIPLLFVHGWPGHFLEVRKLLPLLTSVSPDHPSFHVIALSLPGYGFSEAPKEKGFSLKHYAEAAHKLMLALGYDQYVTQGGDWGYFITRLIAANYGGPHLKAWHTNFPLTSLPTIRNPILILQLLLSKSGLYTPFDQFEIEGLKRGQEFARKGRGYFEEQSTQPQTLGYSMADSPVGLLAWIYEKLVHWTDAYKWEDDEVLDWVSIYWFSRAGPAAAARIYYEARWAKEFEGPGKVKGVLFGVSYFPKEGFRAPSSWMQNVGELKFESRHNHGGHFAAHEEPEELVKDMRKMFGIGGPAYNIVSGKNGY